MHVRPILSTFRRHRAIVAMIVLELAATCAIVCNAIYLIRERLARMDRPTGLAESELVVVRIAGIGATSDADALTAQDLIALRSVPGVASVAATNMLPFGDASWSTDVSTIRDDPAPPIRVAPYLGSADLLETLGVRLVAGRDFTPEEYASFAAVQAETAKVPSVIITRAVAERLFPGANPLGQLLYAWNDEPQVVVGVIDQLARPSDAQGAASAGYAVVLPLTVPFTVGGTYVLRVDPARRGEVVSAVRDALRRVSPDRILLKRQAFADSREDYFQQDRSMAWLLVAVSIALVVVTALGIVGLASFWVQQRTQQIGVRRALGATRGDILAYFLTENFLLATGGIVLGMALAYALNLWLMSAYGVGRMPATFLPIGAALLWGLGQLAVLGPALRASAIPPAIATRVV